MRASPITYRAVPDPDVVTIPGVGCVRCPTPTRPSPSARTRPTRPGNLLGVYGDDPGDAATRIDSADVRIVKSHAAAPVAGATFDWSLTVSNDGPDTAVGPFAVTDTIEAPATFVSRDAARAGAAPTRPAR